MVKFILFTTSVVVVITIVKSWNDDKERYK